MKPNYYKNKIDRLKNIIEEEHNFYEGDNTCDLTAAIRNRFYLWAIELYDGYGIGTDEFKKLKNSLPKKQFRKESLAECRNLLKEVSHIDCTHCNAVVWEYEEHLTENSVWCDCCRHHFAIGQLEIWSM